VIADAELVELERRVRHAIATGDRSGIRLLGAGELSVVLGWPTDAPDHAVKRLPPFADRAAFDAYATVVHDYVARLRARGMQVVDTDVRAIGRDDGKVVGFHVQPVLPTADMVLTILRTTDPTPDHPMISAIVAAVDAVTDGRMGVDAQLANWVWRDGQVHQLDLTTPFVLGPGGGPAFDMKPFLEIMPAPIRGVVGKEMVKLLHRWMTARGALLDLVANAYKEGLDAWVPSLLGTINLAVDPPVSAQEARKTLKEDARIFPVLLRLERGQRWWRQRVRRRPYEFLLPDRTTYERSK
jgi:hypothetical protein